MPYVPDSPLDAALEELSDAIDDFERSSYGTGTSVLERIVALLDQEPLTGFLRARLPSVDYDGWLSAREESVGSVVGSGALTFPAKRAERIALQLALLRDLAESEQRLFEFSYDFCYPGFNSISAAYHKLSDVVFRPLHRDIERMARERELPPLLAPLLDSLPESGDAKLDRLLAEALDLFMNPSPQSQANGLARLWDAFERLKTLDDADKKRSAEKLLERVSPEPKFREKLRDEMLALSDIGNAFHIRHSETPQVELAGESERDYLFHRLLALVRLILVRR